MTPAELEALYTISFVKWCEVARRAGARSEAEDVVQDACVAVLAGATTLPRETHGAMMLRLITTYANTYRRRETRRDSHPLRWGTLPPHDQLANIEQRVTVQRAVDALPAAYHIEPAWVWATVQGYTLTELQGMSTWVVQPTWIRLQRAWVVLREALKAWRGGRKHRGPAARACGEEECR